MSKISLLVVHNRYQQPGGEDTVVRNETQLLRRRGHRVIEYARDNAEIAGYSFPRKALLSVRTTWNSVTYREVGALLRREQPDVAHIHNFFPLISPAAHYACNAAGVPVVQTLHNYRLVCPAATLFHADEPCRRCEQRLSAALRRGCYRNSRLGTGAVSLMLSTHRWLGTWDRCVDAYLAPSRFCADYMVDSGLPARKVHVVANSLARDPAMRTEIEDYALYVGRLTPEKGVAEMVHAWRQLRGIPLLIVGNGPLFGELCRLAESSDGKVKLAGQLNAKATLCRIKRARFLVFPSRWYEPFGMGLLESAACGVPAVASRIGAIPEIVADGETGLMFDPENFDDMARQIRWAWSHPAEMEEMGHAARQRYLEKFTEEKSYEALMNVCGALLN